MEPRDTGNLAAKTLGSVLNIPVAENLDRTDEQWSEFRKLVRQLATAELSK